MNKKIFYFLLTGILVGIGFQTYSNYSTLKSIDSYESCVTSPGSLIQESYPATCITKLGKNFVQNIPLSISSDKDFGFSLSIPPTLIRSVTNVLGNPVVLYCDSLIVGEFNTCENYGISISVYDQPEFGGSCVKYEKLYLGKLLTDYCDDKEASMMSQIYLDRSATKQNSFSILAKYSQTFSKEEVKKILTTFEFTD